MVVICDTPYSNAEYEEHFKILPVILNPSKESSFVKNGKKVSQDFTYDSGTNVDWMSQSELQDWLSINSPKIGN